MIAKSAKVNVATLAYYFDGKDGLYRTVLERLFSDLMSFVPSEVPAVGAETVTWLARTSWAFCTEHRDHIRLVLRHVLDQGLHDDLVMNTYSEPIVHQLQLILQSFRPDWDTVRTRLYIYGTMHMLVRFAIEDRDQLRQLVGQPDDLDAAIISFLEDYLTTELFGGPKPA